MRLLRNPPLATLALLALAASLLMGFLSEAPNRLLSGKALHVRDIAGATPLIGPVIACGAALLVAAALRQTRLVHLLALGAACAGVVLLVACAGQAAQALGRHAPAAARLMLGPGFWIMIFAFSLAAVDALRSLNAGPALRCAVAVAIAAALTTLAVTGRLDALSLAREFAAHRAEFAAAILRHLLLVAATLAVALAAGFPLGIAIQRRRAWRRPVFAVLNVVQTIPSVALFGLLIAPLAAIGLSGIGIVPALVALVLYALLPVVRNTVSGLDGADPAMLEAAAGMGMAPAQILLSVALPVAAPALLAGLRIVTVQTVGLAVVAALIGAGGLGDFVFQGLGQYAVDLVLLGALPAIALALTADFVLQLAAAPFRARLA